MCQSCKRKRNERRSWSRNARAKEMEKLRRDMATASLSPAAAGSAEGVAAAGGGGAAAAAASSAHEFEDEVESVDLQLSDDSIEGSVGAAGGREDDY